MSTTLATDERVLSTLNADGSRRWLCPKPSRGRFWKRRRAVAYGLIALFTILPHIRIGGKPSVLLDIVHREFTFFGLTLYPTDTLLLALAVVGIFLTVFLLTALFGRVWCGWGCPQTVYLEYVYRPIERLMKGEPGRRKKEGAWRTPVMYGLFLLVSLFLAHTFLSYFVGVEALSRWVRSNPLEHPTAFLVMGGVTLAMMFDFCFFREQTCIVACPYGRMQSVMLDRQSLIVAYDRERGEPRGKATRAARKKAGDAANGDVHLNVVSEPVVGDCVDCFQCVTTCPTGIDIRDGLQMECIHCTQCMDACDAVMTKLGREPGLIRYSSQAALEGEKPKRVRPRVIVYPTLLAIVLTAFVATLATRQPAYATVLRGRGAPFTVLESGAVANQVRVKVQNRSPEPGLYTVEVIGPEGARVVASENPFSVGAGDTRMEPMQIVAPAPAFDRGRLEVRVRISSADGFSDETVYQLFGPLGALNSGGATGGGE